jgi:hypothetical protein
LRDIPGKLATYFQAEKTTEKLGGLHLKKPLAKTQLAKAEEHKTSGRSVIAASTAPRYMLGSMSQYIWQHTAGSHPQPPSFSIGK